MLTGDDLKSWATAILIFITIGVCATIVIQIVFHVVLSVSIAIKEQEQKGQCSSDEVNKSIKQEMVEDEMDKLINLKSQQISFTIAGFGFIAALFSLVLGYSPAAMLNIMFICFSLGSIIEGLMQIYYYRRGITNGR